MLAHKVGGRLPHCPNIQAALGRAAPLPRRALLHVLRRLLRLLRALLLRLLRLLLAAALHQCRAGRVGNEILVFPELS